MSQFKKVAFTVYPIKDLKASRAFYEGKLGLKPGDDFEGKWLEYDLGGTTFAISPMIAEWTKPGTQSGVTFEVENVAELVKELTAKGVTFTLPELMETPVCWMTFAKDPDGNTIGLHQTK